MTKFCVEGLQGPDGPSQFGESSRSRPVPPNQSSEASPTLGNENTVAIEISPTASETQAGSTSEVASRTLRRSNRIQKPVLSLNLFRWKDFSKSLRVCVLFFENCSKKESCFLFLCFFL